MHPLESAIRMALDAHAGQRDKAGQPYILHPLRVMQRCDTDTLRIIAVLHDVIEDSAVTLDDLERLGFALEVRDALQCLTKHRGEDYDAFIERVLANPLAARVKEADLLDNMDRSRLAAFTEEDEARMAKYARALKRLRAAR